MSMKNSNDTIGNRTRKLPQPTATDEVTKPSVNSHHVTGHEKWKLICSKVEINLQ